MATTISTTNNIFEMYNRTNTNFITVQHTINRQRCGNTSDLEKHPKKDSFEKQHNKKNNYQKILKSSAFILFCITALGVNYPEMLPRILKRKRKYPAHVEFIAANTLQEAKEFSKKIWKVEHNEISNLNVANWLNYSYTIASNKLKGKIELPKHITYSDSKDAIATINSRLQNLELNKEYLEQIDDVIAKNFVKLFELNYFTPDYAQKSFKFAPIISCKNIEHLDKILDTFLKDNVNKTNNLGFIDKMILYDTFIDILHKDSYINNNPIKCFKEILKNDQLVIDLKNIYLPTDIDSITKEPIENQKKLLKLILTEYNRKYNLIPIATESGCDIILHEIGHLMHYENLYRKSKYHKLSKPKECINKFGKVSKQTKEFKESKEIQATAFYISDYATESPLEFVAETFSKLVNNNKLPKNVLDLYKKYKGPKVNIN